VDTEKRREQILTAAATTFACKGYRQTSITDIIEAAGIARGTVYLYFTSKKAIFTALIDRWFEEVDVLQKREREVPPDMQNIGRFLRENLRRWFEFSHERRDLTLIIFREAVSVDPHFAGRMQALMEHARRQRRELLIKLQQSGYIRADIPVDLLNTCLNSIFREVILDHVLPHETPDLELLADQVQTFIEAGACTRGAAS
jgi:AcrR family transcriptional regulator